MAIWRPLSPGINTPDHCYRANLLATMIVWIAKVGNAVWLEMILSVIVEKHLLAIVLSISNMQLVYHLIPQLQLSHHIVQSISTTSYGSIPLPPPLNYEGVTIPKATTPKTRVHFTAHLLCFMPAAAAPPSSSPRVMAENHFLLDKKLKNDCNTSRWSK